MCSLITVAAAAAAVVVVVVVVVVSGVSQCTLLYSWTQLMNDLFCCC